MTEFQERALDAEDVSARRHVIVWDLHRIAVLDEGEVIAYQDRPTVVLRHADGTTKSWMASLPWEQA